MLVVGGLKTVRLFKLANVQEDISDAVDCKLETSDVFDFDLDSIKNLEKFEDFFATHLEVLHAVDSSNFSERVNRESQENLMRCKCLKMPNLEQARGPHCSFYNGQPCFASMRFAIRIKH